MVKLHNSVLYFVAPPQLITFSILESMIQRNELINSMFLKKALINIKKPLTYLNVIQILHCFRPTQRCAFCKKTHRCGSYLLKWHFEKTQLNAKIIAGIWWIKICNAEIWEIDAKRWCNFVKSFETKMQRFSRFSNVLGRFTLTEDFKRSKKQTYGHCLKCLGIFYIF